MLKEFLEIMTMIVVMCTLTSIADGLNRIYKVLIVIKDVLKKEQG